MGVSLYGDPEELDRLAGQLREWAMEVRQHATNHVRRGQATHWVSAAAQACRDQIVADKTEADRSADDLELAARLLRAHAAVIRERLAQIAWFEKAATAWFEHQAKLVVDSAEHEATLVLNSAEHEVKSVLNTAEHVAEWAGPLMGRAFGDEPWTTWPISLDTLPGTGDKRWLEVGDFMRRQGVL